MIKQNDELDEILDKYDGWEYSTEPLKKEILDWHEREMDRVIGDDCDDNGGCKDCESDNGYYASVHNELRAEQRKRMEGE